MYKKILVALENGQADETLLPHISQLARLLGSELLLIHVADGFAAFVATSAALISSIIVVYSFDYIEGHRAPGEVDHSNEYYLLVVLFLGSMMGIVYSANLIALYLFWELTAVASWRLIGYFRKPRDVERANKAFLTTVGGSLLMLLGFVLIWQTTGSFDFSAIRSHLGTTPISDLALTVSKPEKWAKERA